MGQAISGTYYLEQSTHQLFRANFAECVTA